MQTSYELPPRKLGYRFPSDRNGCDYLLVSNCGSGSTFNAMKKTLLLLTLLILPLGLFGQCKKDPGQNGNFTWDFAVADQPKISGFRLYSSVIQSGPFNNLVGSSTNVAARALTAPVTFATGTIKTFYVVRPYFTSGGGTVEAPDSNSVECELNVPSATNLQVF